MILKQLRIYDPVTATLTEGDLELEGGRILKIGQHLTGDRRDDRWRGGFLLPAFFDAHIHFLMGGMMLEQLDCSGITDDAQLLARLEQHCRRHPTGGWVQGFGLDHTRLALPPDAVNRITREHRLFVQTHDLHSALVNRAALDAAGITAATPDPPDGRIGRDPAGNLTGIVSEGLVWRFRNLIPPPTRAQQVAAIARATALAHSLGVTAVSENATLAEVQLYRELEAERELQMQVQLWYRGGNFDPALLAHPRFRTEELNADAVKCFVDGAFGSRSAAMHQPYRDSSDRGVLMAEVDRITEFAKQAIAGGWRLVLHAIGDRALTVALDALAAAIGAQGQGRGRHRLEHLQVCRPGDIDRLQQLEILPSLQPLHLLHDQKGFHAFLTPEQLEHTYPWRPFLERDQITPFGTDWPVEPLDPLLNLVAAVTRRHRSSPEPFRPEESFPLAAALRRLTYDPAVGACLETERGSLQPGQRADLVLLSADPFEVSPAELEELRVLATWRRGELVYTNQGS